jgi:hypothetical protein
MSRGARPRSWPKSDLGLIGKVFLITIETARIVTVPKLVAPRSPDSGSSRRRRSPLRRSSKVSTNHRFTSPTVGVAKHHAARVVVHLDQADVEPTPDASSKPVTFSSAPQRSELDAGCRRVTWF